MERETRIRRKGRKGKLISKKLEAKEEKKIGMGTKLYADKDRVGETKLTKEVDGEEKHTLLDKLQCDSSDSGSKSGSDSGSKSGSDSGSKSGSDSGSKSRSSTVNTRTQRSIGKGLNDKSSLKIVKEDKKNDLLNRYQANKYEDKETKMIDEDDEDKDHSMIQCDSSDSGSKSESDSGSKSGSDSSSKSGSTTLKEKETNTKIRRKVLKENIKQLSGIREVENKIGLVAALEFSEDKTQEVGEGAMDEKLNLSNKLLSDRYDFGSKSNSDTGLGVDMTVIADKLEETIKMDESFVEAKSFLKKLKEKLPYYHKKPIKDGDAIERKEPEKDVQGLKEKKGILEKIMGKLPSYHKNSEDETEKIVDTN